MNWQVSDAWVERCHAQIKAVLSVLEADRASRTDHYWFSQRPGYADTAAAAAWLLLFEAHPGLISSTEYPALASHCSRLEAMPVFKLIAQAFVAPA